MRETLSMNTPRQAARRLIDGQAAVVGRPFRRYSKCQLCGLDSGPWLTRRSAELSGLVHLVKHHGSTNFVPEEE